MCQSLMELVHLAEECGWFGYSRGPGDFLVYRCGCDQHLACVSGDADDPTYYEDMCNYISQCRT